MTAPVSYNITLQQGATHRELFTWQAGTPAQPVNLTGCTAHLQVRPSVNSPTVLVDLTTVNGGIVLGGTAGTIELVFLPEHTEGKPWRAGVYDLEITHTNADVRRLLAGSVAVNPEVTRD